MPSWNDIVQEHSGLCDSIPCDSIRKKYIKTLSDLTKRNTIVYYSAWLQKQSAIAVDFNINDIDKMGFMSTIKGLDKSKGLDLVLHTPGGSIAALESLVEYLKAIFKEDIRAIIPQSAFSAGTMWALSCKEIIMGEHSSLGPIDPQFGRYPAHGIIEEFKQAKEEITKKPQLIYIWQPILNQYNPTLIGECNKAIIWAETIVKEWLGSNMFKEESSKEKKKIINKVIKELGSHALTFAHDRHISPKTLKNLGLTINMLEDNEKLQDAVLSVHHACMLTLTETHVYKIIENQNGITFAQQSKPERY